MFWRTFKLAVAAIAFGHLAAPAHAQELLELDGFCQYSGDEELGTVYGFESDQAANDAVARILRYTGLEKNFLIRAANVPNASAAIQGETRLILYNQNFMLRVADVTRSDWAAISIMAHELGHHLQGHTIQSGGSRPEIELQADRFSGFVLQRMGASLEESQLAMNAIGSPTGSSTHPARDARLAAIANGWVAARDLQGNTGTPGGPAPGGETPPNPRTNPPTTNPGNPVPPVTQPGPQYQFEVQFQGDPSRYFVTVQNDIIAVAPNGATAMVGRRTPPSMPQFAWMYSLPTATYGVTPDGRVFARTPFGQDLQIGVVVAF